MALRGDRRSAAWLLCYLLVGAAGHGAMNRPVPRENHNQEPIVDANGRMAEGGPGCLGDACGWFNQGCVIGCPCLGKTNGCGCGDCNCSAGWAYRWGVPLYSTPAMSNCSSPIEPTIAADSPLRTYNMELKSAKGDWTKYFPWRAPGSSMVLDPCGVATDALKLHPPGTDGYPAWFNGTMIPEPAGVEATQWPAGGTAVVSHALAVNHAGGYQYRVCPKTADGAPPTEACFRGHALLFARNTSTVHWEDGSRADVAIPAADVTRGVVPAGSMWRRGPIPACNCDENDGCSEIESVLHPSLKPYAKEPGSGECKTGYQFKPPCEGCFGWREFSFSIMDEVKVPSKRGAYYLQWRWDCEQTPQVWNSCADIVVV